MREWEREKGKVDDPYDAGSRRDWRDPEHELFTEDKVRKIKVEEQHKVDFVCGFGFKGEKSREDLIPIQPNYR